MGRSHVEPGGEASKTGTIFLHAGNGSGGNKLGAQGAEEIGVGDQEILDLAFLRDLGEVGSHAWSPYALKPLFEISRFVPSHRRMGALFNL